MGTLTGGVPIHEFPLWGSRSGHLNRAMRLACASCLLARFARFAVQAEIANRKELSSAPGRGLFYLTWRFISSIIEMIRGGNGKTLRLRAQFHRHSGGTREIKPVLRNPRARGLSYVTADRLLFRFRLAVWLYCIYGH